MSQDPLDEDLALVRELMRSRPATVEPHRKTRLWAAIDENIHRRERPFRWGWFAGLAAAAAAAAIAVWSADRPPAAIPAPPRPGVAERIDTAENNPRPLPVEKTRWITAQPKTIEVPGATLALAENSELELGSAGNYHLVSGTVEVSIDAASPVVFTVAGAKVSAVAARIRLARSPSGPTLELLSGAVREASGFLPPPAPVRKISLEQQMIDADRERIAGRVARAIAAYEVVARDPAAATLREEAMLRQAELYRATGRSGAALRVLAAADAQISNGLLLPERVALEVELLLAAGRIDDAKRALEKGQNVDGPALARARELLLEKSEPR